MAAISNDWLPVLKEEFGKPYYRQLLQTVRSGVPRLTRSSLRGRIFSMRFT